MASSFSVLINPRTVFPQLAARPSLVWTVAFACVLGIERNFHELFKRAIPLSDMKPLPEIFGLNVLSGIVFGVSMMWVSSWVLAWSSRQLGGVISSSAMRTVLAWSAAPKMLSMLGLFVLFASQGQYFLLQDRKGLLTSSPVLVGTFLLVQMVCSIWGVVVGVVGLSELAKLSIGKSIGAYLLGALILLAPLLGGTLLWASVR